MIYNLTDLATYLGYSRNTIHQWINTGKIKRPEATDRKGRYLYSLWTQKEADKVKKAILKLENI